MKIYANNKNIVKTLKKYVIVTSMVTLPFLYNNNVEAKIIDDNVSVDTEITDLVPSYYAKQINQILEYDEDNILTESDLVLLGSDNTLINLEVNNDDLSWLSKCPNITRLNLKIYNDNESLSNIKFLPKLRNLCLTSWLDDGKKLTLYDEKFAFLKDIDTLRYLLVNGFFVEPTYFNDFTQLDTLVLGENEVKTVDFEELTYLEKLCFNTNKAYDIAIGFSNEAKKTLEDNGVLVSYVNETNEDIVDDINNKLDEAILSLDVDENSSSIDKIDAILVYVMDNYEYSDEVREMGEDLTEAEFNEITSYYEGGYLSPVYNKDEIICGNYAALVTALANRLDLRTDIITNKNHAWNIVKIDGKYYYFDVTGLENEMVMTIDFMNRYYGKITDNKTDPDNTNSQKQRKMISFDAVSAILAGNTDDLYFYQIDPLDQNEYFIDNKVYDGAIIPEYIELKPIVKDDMNYFELMINNKLCLIPALLLLNIITALILATKINDYKKIKKLNKQLQEENKEEIKWK